MIAPFNIPEYVKEAIQRLDESGHTAYIVGGSVRDYLLKKTLKITISQRALIPTN